MIIRDKNDSRLKGSMLRGFNNTPSNIRDQINKANMMVKKYNEDKREVLENKPSEYKPSRERDLLTKMNRINK